MQSKRKKRSRIRAAKPTSGFGHKKKNRGAGHTGGRGRAGSGKRGEVKLMMFKTSNKYLGKQGFTSIKKKLKTINLTELQRSIEGLVEKGKAIKNKDAYEVDLIKLGYDKLLSKGNITHKLNIKVKKATPNAISRIEKVGGKVEIVE